MSYTLPSGCWCNIFLNVHASSQNKNSTVIQYLRMPKDVFRERYWVNMPNWHVA